MWRFSNSKYGNQWTSLEIDSSNQSKHYSVPGKKEKTRCEGEPWHFLHLSSTSEYNSKCLDLEKWILWWTLNWKSARRVHISDLRFAMQFFEKCNLASLKLCQNGRLWKKRKRKKVAVPFNFIDIIMLFPLLCTNRNIGVISIYFHKNSQCSEGDSWTVIYSHQFN